MLVTEDVIDLEVVLPEFKPVPLAIEIGAMFVPSGWEGSFPLPGGERAAALGVVTQSRLFECVKSPAGAHDSTARRAAAMAAVLFLTGLKVAQFAIIGIWFILVLETLVLETLVLETLVLEK